MMLEIAGRAAQVLVALAGAYLVVLWFALIVWTFRDIETRSRSVFTQVFSTLLSVLFFVPGVLVYLLLRPKEILDEAFQRSLEEEYLLQDLEELPHCPNCHRYVEDEFVLCPHCHAQLREPCGGCERLVDLRWPLCPYCGIVQSEHGEPVDRVEAPAARWTAPALRRRRSSGSVTRPQALPAASESEREEVAMLLPRSRSDAGDSLASRDEDTSSLAASLASGMRSMVRPLDRLLGRGSVDSADDTTSVTYSTNNGHRAETNGSLPDHAAADPTRNGTTRQRSEVDSAEPVVLPRNRFAGNGQHGPARNGSDAARNGNGPDASDALADFPSESDRTERQADPAVVGWPPRDNES